jgi:hypothetical protein
MHSIKNIIESNKIDTQSRADTYIRRTRLISKSDYNLNLKVFVKLKKTLKTQKKPKKPKKKQKNPLGWVFLKKPGFFPTLIWIQAFC